MNDILFRGKSLKTNKWVYGSCNLENTLAKMEEVKLKPCPFCGAKPFLLINSSAERIYVKIKCNRCDMVLKNLTIETMQLYLSGDLDKLEKWKVRK